MTMEQGIAQRVREHYDALADQHSEKGLRSGYYRELRLLTRHLIPPGQSVLAIGCGDGSDLVALEPSRGVGIDISPRMIERARAREADPGRYRYIVGDACDAATYADLKETFDVILVAGVCQEMEDVQAFLDAVRQVCTHRTRLVIIGLSRAWQAPLKIAEWMGLKRPQPVENWLPQRTMEGILGLADFEVVREIEHLICPLPLGPVSRFLNRYIGHLPVLRHASLLHVLIARPIGDLDTEPVHPADPSVSVVIPCRNESGHIASLHERIPALPAGSEVIWVEGNSTDDTAEVLQALVRDHPEKPYVFLQQPGRGKGDAVRHAYAHAKGDILLILDADVTVAPEDVPRFADVLRRNQAEFVNGTRLVYPMHERAMRFLNLLANKSFALIFQGLLGQQVTDTLCGTKVMWRTDYETLAANRAYFGDFDPFGDFDLLLGASRMHLKIADLPIRYGERTYGETNISRFSHGWLLLRMVAFSARKVYFI